MFKNFFCTFLYFKIFNLNHFSKNKIETIEPTEPIEPKLDFSLDITSKIKYKMFKYFLF